MLFSLIKTGLNVIKSFCFPFVLSGPAGILPLSSCSNYYFMRQILKFEHSIFCESPLIQNLKLSNKTLTLLNIGYFFASFLSVLQRARRLQEYSLKHLLLCNHVKMSLNVFEIDFSQIYCFCVNRPMVSI